MTDQLPGPGTRTTDPARSRAEFTAGHFTAAFARGIASGPAGSVTIADDLASSSARASVDVPTLTTADKVRDEKVPGPGVLDAARFPAIDFASAALPAAGGGCQLDGDLTLHGITRPVTLAPAPHGVITDVRGKARLGLTATAQIQRSDLDVLKRGHVALAAGGFMVPDAVRVTLEIEAVRDEQP